VSKWLTASNPPPRCGNVLVTDGRSVEIGCYLPKARKWERTAFLGHILYWMPLPKPPEESS